jgi:hypothetical protein
MKYKYEGVWNGRKSYNVDDVVTHEKALWFCSDAALASCGVPPGSSETVWLLAVVYPGSPFAPADDDEADDDD